MRLHNLLVLAILALSSIACGGPAGLGLDLFGGEGDSGREKNADSAPSPYDGTCVGTPQTCELADASYLCSDACQWTESLCAGTPTPCRELDDVATCYEADCEWDIFAEIGEPRCTGVARPCVADDYDFVCAPGCTFTPGSCTAIVDGCANLDYKFYCEEAGCVWEN